MKKQYRIKKSKDIEMILNYKSFVKNPYFIIYSKKQNETSHFRYAMSVNKKIGNAVVRNHLKRQVRAIIRQLNIVEYVDIFIIVRSKTLELTYFEMNMQLSNLLQKQKLLVKGE